MSRSGVGPSDGSRWFPVVARLTVAAALAVLAVERSAVVDAFMETYGQSAGCSLAQVAIRAGHDPAVAAEHYTGRVSEEDRALAEAVERLLNDDGSQ